MVDKYLKGEREKLVIGEFQREGQGVSEGTAPELAAGGGWDRERAGGLGRCADDAVGLSTS